jgi:hypothetical protein
MLKKILFIAILAGISYFNINAQKLKYGLIAGFDVANDQVTNKLKFDDSRVYYPLLSYNFNLYLGYKSSGFLGFSIEPGYIKKGGVRKDVFEHSFSSGTLFQGDINYHLNYIQVPILVDFYILPKLFISIGPELSYMINAKGIYNDSPKDISDMYDRKFELSGIIGVNYNIIKNLDIGLRYNHGLSYITKIRWTDENGNYLMQSTEYTQYFQMILRFKI